MKGFFVAVTNFGGYATHINEIKIYIKFTKFPISITCSQMLIIASFEITAI